MTLFPKLKQNGALKRAPKILKGNGAIGTERNVYGTQSLKT